MKNFSLIALVIFSSVLISSCGGGASSDDTTTHSENDNNDNNTNDENTNEFSTGNDNLNDISSYLDDTPKTSVLIDRQKDYPTLNETTRVDLRITQTQQNSSTKPRYNFWRYSYSPTKIESTISFESYASNNALPEIAETVIYEQLARQDYYEYNPRTVVKSNNSRKLTSYRYTGGESYLSRIVYDTKTTLIFDKKQPPTLIDFRILKESELIHAGLQEGNRDFCSEEFSTEEIDFSVEGSGYLQIGDKITMTVHVVSPVVSCNSDNIASIVGHAETMTTTVSTLTRHIAVFSLRGHDFNDVLEFTTKQTSRLSSGKIFAQSITKNYLQNFVGQIAEVELSCLGSSVDDPKAICSTLEEVATNVPTIPEI